MSDAELYFVLKTGMHWSNKSTVIAVFFNWAPRHGGVLGEWCIAPRILDLDTPKTTAYTGAIEK
jgi:hypothetical protein